MIENLTFENDLVLHTFPGSGTTAVAAKTLNRRFVGCDEDEAAVNKALARLAEESEQTEADATRHAHYT